MTGAQLERYFKELIRKKKSKAISGIQIFLDHEKAIYRQKAVQALCNFDFDIVREDLFKMLEDAALSVKKEAANSLIRSAKSENPNFLNEYLATCSDEKLKEHIQLLLRRGHHQQTGVISVAEFIGQVNTILGQEEVKIQGELSSYQVSSYASNQWVFFDLKDEKTQAKIRCFSTLFVVRAARLSLVDGMRLIITGKPRVSPKSGIFSINVSQLEISGEGELLKAFELLKQQLNQEGLFLASRKRDIPDFPKKIGLITSQDAAAYKDFVKVLQERMGGLEIYFHHAQVQGDLAADSLVKAIENLSSFTEIEVIVITRGGGSMDDLHAFNDEQVARAIYASQKPIISAVGHERDETIADYVADLRASTPSNAAELLVPHKKDILNRVFTFEQNLKDTILARIKLQSQFLEHSINLMIMTNRGILQIYSNATEKFTYHFKALIFRMQQMRSEVNHSSNNLVIAWEYKLKNAMQSVVQHEQLIKSFDVKPILKRGFSIVRFNQQLLKESHMPVKGDKIQVSTLSSHFEAIVTKERNKN